MRLERRRPLTGEAGVRREFALPAWRARRARARWYGRPVTGRAFPIVYARDVERSVRFYERLGFEEHFRLPVEGEPGYVGLRRADGELGVVTVASPEQLIGVAVGSGPRFELFVYVNDVDRQVEELRQAGVSVLREPAECRGANASRTSPTPTRIRWRWPRVPALRPRRCRG